MTLLGPDPGDYQVTETRIGQPGLYYTLRPKSVPPDRISDYERAIAAISVSVTPDTNPAALPPPCGRVDSTGTPLACQGLTPNIWRAADLSAVYYIVRQDQAVVTFSQSPDRPDEAALRRFSRTIRPRATSYFGQ